MDNDDLRRGRPTSHKVFGEGLAILAGDGLLNAALELALKAALRMGDIRGIRAAELLARHAGVTGMIAGQTVDVTMEGSTPTEELVSYIHTHKTSDLLQAPMEMGLTLAGADPAPVELGRLYGEHLDAEAHVDAALEAMKGLPWDTSFFENLARASLKRVY